MLLEWFLEIKTGGPTEPLTVLAKSQNVVIALVGISRGILC